jgi:transposase-like protein
LWAAVESIAPKIGCVPQTLLQWVKRVEVDAGVREGVTASGAQRLKRCAQVHRDEALVPQIQHVWQANMQVTWRSWSTYSPVASWAGG